MKRIEKDVPIKRSSNGLTEGYGGFPDIWLEDRIFQVIRQANHDLLLEEERRLFYVALTRARDKLYLITEKGNESSFLKEIPDIYTVNTSIFLKSVVEKVILCRKCFSPLEKMWIVCPYCDTPAPDRPDVRTREKIEGGGGCSQIN